MNGTVYTESGTYTFNTNSINGCDSIAKIYIDIKPTSTSQTTISSCGAYEWNGLTYVESGTYQYDTIGFNGCDSISYLELEICYADYLNDRAPRRSDRYFFDIRCCQ